MTHNRVKPRIFKNELIDSIASPEDLRIVIEETVRRLTTQWEERVKTSEKLTIDVNKLTNVHVPIQRFLADLVKMRQAVVARYASKRQNIYRQYEADSRVIVEAPFTMGSGKMVRKCAIRKLAFEFRSTVALGMNRVLAEKVHGSTEYSELCPFEITSITLQLELEAASSQVFFQGSENDERSRQAYIEEKQKVIQELQRRLRETTQSTKGFRRLQQDESMLTDIKYLYSEARSKAIFNYDENKKTNVAKYLASKQAVSVDNRNMLPTEDEPVKHQALVTLLEDALDTPFTEAVEKYNEKNLVSVAKSIVANKRKRLTEAEALTETVKTYLKSVTKDEGQAFSFAKKAVIKMRGREKKH